MTLNAVPKKAGLKDKYYYQAIELLLQDDDEGESEAKLREMLRENIQAKNKAAGRGSGSAASGTSRPGQEKPSFMRSFSRDERSQAKQSLLMQAKNKPQAALWTPSNSLSSPAWMKNIKRESSPRVKSEGAEPEAEEVMLEKGNSPEDERAKRKHSEMEEEEVQMASGSSFPPGSPAFSSPPADPTASSPVGSPPTGMPPHKKAMLGKSTEGVVHAIHNRDQKIKKKLKEVKKNREARSVRPTFNK